MKLFAFGDSFTNGYNDTNTSWVRDYIKWKGYKPKAYIDFIGEHYNIEVNNYATQGCDNQSILESFCKNFSLIEPGDIVIINWTEVARYRLATIDDQWRFILPVIDNKSDNIDVSKQAMEEILANRLSKIYIDEVKTWIQFVDHICKEMKTIQWCLKYPYDLNINVFGPYELITQETKGEVVNGHFSESGNKLLANEIIKILENE